MSENTKSTIDKLTHDGRGIARINGKITFITDALPGEEVTFHYTKKRSQYDEGQLDAVITPSADRVKPECQHYGICGGCSLQHMHHRLQITTKQALLLAQLEHIGKVQPLHILPPIISEPWGYRRKARLGVKHVAKKHKVLVGFRERNPRFIADIQSCSVLHPSVGKKISALSELIASLEAHQQIPQIEVAIGDDATGLVFRHLAPLIASDIEKLRSFGQVHQLHIYLQPKSNDSVYLLWPENTSPLLSYKFPTYDLELLFHPMDFTQVNNNINQQMVTQAIKLLAPQENEHILDLFCGLGNFTLPLAKHCQRVTGVEGTEAMVKRAQANAAHNNITNTEFYAADLTQDISNAVWAQKKYEKILLDPPRSGAFELVTQIAGFQAQRIVYVACNPATLARDAAELVKQGYQLTHAGILDMFPHTSHVESMAVFEKN